LALEERGLQPSKYSLVADDDETLVPLELAAAVRGVSSHDQSPVSQTIPLVERDLHLGRVSEGARFARRALAADRKKCLGLQLREPRAVPRRDLVVGQGPAFGDHGIAIGFAHNSRAARPRLDRMAGTDKDVIGLAVRGSIFSRRDQDIVATIGSALTADGEKFSGFRLGHSANPSHGGRDQDQFLDCRAKGEVLDEVP